MTPRTSSRRTELSHSPCCGTSRSRRGQRSMSRRNRLPFCSLPTVVGCRAGADRFPRLTCWLSLGLLVDRQHALGNAAPSDGVPWVCQRSRYLRPKSRCSTSATVRAWAHCSTDWWLLPDLPVSRSRRPCALWNPRPKPERSRSQGRRRCSSMAVIRSSPRASPRSAVDSMNLAAGSTVHRRCRN